MNIHVKTSNINLLNDAFIEKKRLKNQALTEWFALSHQVKEKSNIEQILKDIKQGRQ